MTLKRAHERRKNSLQVTPDGRYFVVKGRLWRMSNPSLPAQTRSRLVGELMQARRDIAAAHRRKDLRAEKEARVRVHRAKLALGERGPVWWEGTEGDHNRRLVKATPYARWFNSLPARR